MGKEKSKTKKKVETKTKETVKKEEVVKVETNETRKYIIITVVVLIFSIVVGYFIGKYLFNIMYS